MQIIEGLTDAEIAEAHRSKDVFDEVRDMTAPLDAFLSLIHAFDWLDLRSRAMTRRRCSAFLTGSSAIRCKLRWATMKPSKKQDGRGRATEGP